MNPLSFTLSVNGTSASNYASLVYPGDVLNLTAQTVPVVANRQLIFYGNLTSILGNLTTNIEGKATLMWKVPDLTLANVPDHYVFNVGSL